VRFLYGHSLNSKGRTRFRRTLRELRRHFEFVSNMDAVRLLRDPTPPAGRYLAFSFDDGFRDNYELVAPLLHEAGARACFFLVSNFVGCNEEYRRSIIEDRLRCRPSQLPMSWDMVRELRAAGFEIGAHTTDHHNLASLSLDEAVLQIRQSKRAIEAESGAKCKLFAWPYGTAATFPEALLAAVRCEFDAIFSAIRHSRPLALNGAVVNRDHFEPGWPTTHVRFFVRSPKRMPNVPPGYSSANVLST
jgi:peptidoglycan/xylan/chitin deacetylase (PgdA/CDA1 family)